MIIRRFEKDDLDKLAIQDEQKHEFSKMEYPKETSFTLVNGGEIVGVFGISEVFHGRAMVFSFISKDAGSYMLKMVKYLRWLIDNGMKKTGAVRLEMTVLASFEHGERFAKLLGFECEGVMRKYYKGLDYKLFARVK